VALSQNVVINFLTKFDKKGLERATKELKGFDKVVATGTFALTKFAKVAGIAAVAGLSLFTKNSIQAALSQERLDKSLQLTLASIGRVGATSETNDFIQGLQSATNVSEDQLIPALQQLIAQTNDLETSQSLLKVALDVSAGTGKDLNAVIDAITKAAVGNTKSIGSLGVGFTAAQAKAMGFTKVMQSLERFTGAAEAQTLTFDGQLKSFKISAGEASETLGTGFITAYAIIAGGRPLIQDLGRDLETAATQFSNIFVGIAAVTKEEGLGIYGQLAKVLLQGLVGDTSALEALEKAGIKAISNEKITANQREDRIKSSKRILTFDEIIADIQKKILAAEKLTTKEKKAQADLDKKRLQLQSLFDLDKINLQAALSRKLNAEDELRVRILQKLADGTAKAVDEAQRYADVLKIIEDGVITTTEIDELAKKWGMTTAGVTLYIQELFKANDEIRKMLALLNQKPTVITPAVVPTAEKYPESFNKDLIEAFGLFSGISVAGLNNMPQLAEGGIVNKPTIAMIGEAGAEAVVPLDRMGSMGTKVIVNVQGSVISEGQLQSVIQDVLYNLNRTGAVTQLANLGR
jgi:hypothetical protein